MNTRNAHCGYGRNAICALAACVFTVVLLNGISHAPVQTAQRAVLQHAEV